jgi:hypothetical protein
MSVGNKILVHAGQREQFPEDVRMSLGRLRYQTASQVSHAVTSSQAAAIDNGRGIILGFVDNRRNPSKDTQGIPSTTESVSCASSQSRATACWGDLLSVA